jgi:cell division septal protein FtsQ
MEERLMELTRGKQPQPNNNHRIVGAAKATVMMLAALTGVLVVAWSFLRPQ